jgi:hypothetical protein
VGLPERYYCAALDLYYYPSDDQGSYGLNAGYFTSAKGQELLVVYATVGGGVYIGQDPSYYFKPLP